MPCTASFAGEEWAGRGKLPVEPLAGANPSSLVGLSGLEVGVRIRHAPAPWVQSAPILPSLPQKHPTLPLECSPDTRRLPPDGMRTFACLHYAPPSTFFLDRRAPKTAACGLRKGGPAPLRQFLLGGPASGHSSAPPLGLLLTTAALEDEGLTCVAALTE